MRLRCLPFLLFASLPAPCLAATTQHFFFSGNQCLHIAADRVLCYIKPRGAGWVDVTLCYNAGSTMTRLTVMMPQSPNTLDAAYATLKEREKGKAYHIYLLQSSLV